MITWDMQPPIPGLTIGSAQIGGEAGAITGTPTQAGAYDVVITANDFGSNCYASCATTIYVNVPVGSVPPQYLPPGGYVYDGGTPTDTAPPGYTDLGNSSTSYYTPGGTGDDSDSENRCFVGAGGGSGLALLSLFAALAFVALVRRLR